MSEQLCLQMGGITYKFNKNQQKFLTSSKKYIGYIGGRGCGKSLALCVKIIELLQKYPNNHGLLAREDYSDLRDSTERDFLDTCPPEFIKQHYKQEKKILFHNGSTLFFRGLKGASKNSIRSLNLGFYALEQAEEMDESIIDELDACLRRKIVDWEGKPGEQQAFYLANPTLNWVWRKFRQ